MCRTLLLLTACLALPSLARAQFSPAPFLLAGEYQPSTDIDGPGSFSRATIRARAGVPLYLGEDAIVGLSAGYQYETFDFENLTIESFDEITRPRIALFIKQELANGWSWIAIPWLTSNRQNGADFSDSLNFGGISAGWYQVNESLLLGFGVGFSTQFEDSASVFPIPVINWEFAQNWTLTTLPPEGFRISPGASLDWQATPQLGFALVYQFQTDRHRLNDDNLATANGVGEFSQQRIALASTYQFNKNLSLTAFVGLAFDGEIEQENSSGNTLDTLEFDSSLLFGFQGSLSF